MQTLSLGREAFSDPGRALVPASTPRGLTLPKPEGSAIKLARCVVASWDAEAGLELRAALETSSGVLPVTLLTGLNGAPPEAAAQRIIETERAAVLFLDVENIELASAMLEAIRRLDRGTQVVAFSRQATQDTFLTLMRFGVKEWLRLPCYEHELEPILIRIRAELAARPPQLRRVGHILTVLPAKPGSGASTFAAHAARAFAADLDARPLLVDFDFNCGIQGFLHASGTSMTVADAAEYADRMDDVIWGKMIASAGPVDLLRSGKPVPGHRTDPAALRMLLNYVESRYPAVLVDLSGNWERYAIEALERSSLIFIVTTTDFSSLHMARRQLDLLEEIGAREHARVVLNRCVYRGAMRRDVVEEILGQKPALELPNAFRELQEAIAQGRLLPSSTPYGHAIRQLPVQFLPCLQMQDQQGRKGAGARRPGLINALRTWLLPGSAAPENA